MSENETEPQAALLEQQSALATFGQLALQSENLDEILYEACRLVAQCLGTDYAKVMELQPDGETLLVRAGIGWKPGVVGSATVRAQSGSASGHALLTGEAVTSVDTKQEKRFAIPEFLKEHGVRSLVNVIIERADNEPPYGILEVDDRTPREFSTSDVSFLRTYANLLGAAVTRLQTMNELRLAVEQREQLLAELQHRVKNNLQVITGLVHIQASRAASAETRGELNAIGRRIDALRLLYDRLYATGAVDRVDFGTYVGELASGLIRFHGEQAADVRLRIDVGQLVVALEKAVPLGLIINEFITNSLKYAFDEGGGMIGVDVDTQADRRARLTLWDNGRGMPRDAAERRGTGMRLIEGLAKQIAAAAQWTSEGGTRLTIEFSPLEG